MPFFFLFFLLGGGGIKRILAQGSKLTKCVRDYNENLLPRTPPPQKKKKKKKERRCNYNSRIEAQERLFFLTFIFK